MDRPISSEENCNFIRRKTIVTIKRKEGELGKDSDFAAKAGYVKGSVYFLKLLNKLGLFGVVLSHQYNGFAHQTAADLPL